jgi:hypothetical protein
MCIALLITVYFYCEAAKFDMFACPTVRVRGGIKIKLEYFNKKTMVRVRKVFIS